MHPLDVDTLIGFAVAAGVGLAIGLERGWKELAGAEHSSSAGVRTFTVVGLVGGLCGWMQTSLGVPMMVPGLAAVALLSAAGYVLSVWRGGGIGFTTEFALLVTYLLAALAGAGFWALASSLAVAVALVLAMKTEIHAVVGGLERREMLSTVQLLVLAVLVVPLLPNREVLDLEGLNPRTIGVLALLISAISYVGYFSVQFLGVRAGLLLTATLGGLSSSTAVTASYARMAREQQAVNPALGVGVAIACAIMGARVLVVVGLIAPALLAGLVWPMGVLTLVPLAAAGWSLRRERSRSQQAAVTLNNPLSLRASLLFAAVLTALFLLVPLVRDSIGATGVYLLAALSGVADVDAISLSISRDADSGQLGSATAVVSITLAAISNTLMKAGIAWVGSARKLGYWAVVLLTAALAALVTALLARLAV